MTIILVEDDRLQRDWLMHQLTGKFGKDAKFLTAASESEFYSMLDSTTTVASADLAIVDMRLPWATPGDAAPHPSECLDPTQAGVRCCLRLREIRVTKRVPAIIYTVQTDEDTDEPEKLSSHGIALVTKRANTEALWGAVEHALSRTTE